MVGLELAQLLLQETIAAHIRHTVIVAALGMGLTAERIHTLLTATAVALGTALTAERIHTLLTATAVALGTAQTVVPTKRPMPQRQFIQIILPLQ